MTIPIWLMVGVAAIALINAKMFVKIFDKYIVDQKILYKNTVWLKDINCLKTIRRKLDGKYRHLPSDFYFTRKS